MVPTHLFRILILGNPTFHQKWAHYFHNSYAELQHYDTLQAADSFLAQHAVALTIFDSKESDAQHELSLCAQIHSKIKAPLLLLTHFANEEHLVLAYQQGISDFLIHPVSSSLLLAKLAVWLRWATFPDSVIISSIIDDLAAIPRSVRTG